MTTGVRPKSGLDWRIEIPESVSKADPELSTRHFSQILYNIAMAARFGFEKTPKSLPLDEQAFLQVYRNVKSSMKMDKPFRDSHIEDNTLDSYLRDLGEITWVHARIAITEPQVRHFIGGGSEANDDEADKWTHAGH